ncbi:phage tail protein [Paenibacillus hamazuiensis]|uniref:phage tail protein n=1 Tax=Paenibacillus hamazuiensis TaxID=2936508 RepID=UPI00200BA7CD|nr:tail fiber protein [Paenibacillus hamazuiensis]
MAVPYVGEIRMIAGNFAPVGWAFCNGQILSISEYTLLYSLIGTTYGGDGVTTFCLPDLRGRAPMHMGQGPGLSFRSIGERGGVEAVTLTVSQIPSHSHEAGGQSERGTSNIPTNGVWAQSTMNQYKSPFTPVGKTMHSQAVGSAGGGAAHDNMMPYTAIHFIIALDGTIPPRA